MPHHPDSPLAREDIRLDITDLYVFRGEFGTVFAINVCHSIFGAVPVPGYHPEGRYEFKIDLDGDSVEELTYRLTFEERDAAGNQRYALRRIADAAAADADAAGTVIALGRTDETVLASDGSRLWAGKAGDPFWIEPDVLHAVGHSFQDGTVVDLAGWDRGKAKNPVASHTVYSIVLEVPDTQFAAAEGGRIGVWAVAAMATGAGGWRPVNRIGLPMIHPLFTQFDEEPGTRLNAGVPGDDVPADGEQTSNSIASVVTASGTSADPAGYGKMVARRFRPNVLPYVVGTPATFGFGGWNGRSLTDNVADVIFPAAANTPIMLGIGRELAVPRPSDVFPYMPPASLSPVEEPANAQTTQQFRAKAAVT